jgi:peptidoglycan-N-acetylglucosamine deacetylase
VITHLGATTHPGARREAAGLGRARVIAHRNGLKTRAVALTFDDGPSAWTEPILDILGETGARATFFVIGDAIAGREHIVRRIVDEGHEVANHTATHPRLDLLASSSDIESEIRLATQVIEDATNTSPVLFRPPGFNYTPEVLDVAGQCGFGWVVLAGVAMADYNMPSPRKIARKVLWRVRRGSIIALHDGRPPHEPPLSAGGTLEGRSQCVEAVRLVVPRLTRRGYRVCTASELLAL